MKRNSTICSSVETSLIGKQRTNKLNQHITTILGIEPRPRWRKARALTTMLPLLNGWSFLSLFTWKIYFCVIALSAEPQIEIFSSSFDGRRHGNVLICVPHRQHDCFSSFNQSYHWFDALSLPLSSSSLKIPYIFVRVTKDVQFFHAKLFVLHFCINSWKFEIVFSGPLFCKREFLNKTLQRKIRLRTFAPKSSYGEIFFISPL